ncbi:hypothetical protein LEWO105114_05445 [Legionella worsleiensis]|uniref:Uncharacterized protein n=1 Tax=Legionella worsleiensis TaxID=45076 RepID=A0A0W1AH80_9GAMM|nr:hypothetical protein Lwor_0973 [Legionella worsleiensis]STY32692.1 Uncharacterised protein [Legionella worsleiensis]
MLKDAFKGESRLNPDMFALMAEPLKPVTRGWCGMLKEGASSVLYRVVPIMLPTMHFTRIQQKLGQHTLDAVMITPSSLGKCKPIRPVKSGNFSGFRLNRTGSSKARNSSRHLVRPNPEKEAADRLDW